MVAIAWRSVHELGWGMQREPSLTFEGALKILGHHEPQLIGKLDTLLGGVILASGAATGIAVVGGPALAPAAMFAAVWGFTEQKNQAMELLREAVRTLSGRLAQTRGYERAAADRGGTHDYRRGSFLRVVPQTYG